ncbi:Inner membrane protein YohK [Photobacterium damselae subsp. piscicida]|uniref:CidB/LrgB family autolysis modulator n=1 Tax=Photobacterium damsela subsp. piscicida TaxID=38294 RepID=L7NK19_PHODP|nr:CidB/LrgB family autolysis modulator [Photobacterium damselae]AEU10044.1 putative yohK (seritonin transporter) [Photobacterium damselae subsp. piscicida]MBE8129263.1 CidB/LrgB family autolysis modulator [Photobacterium damselae subsp. piscicida]MDP2514221.1 CidB/LrgB family autolysis modulator [Photobacterium damselae subsp. piscicida]MDP2532779.1 CidB/LrgB family autolysis modulator [Photobacterium damselae subsp. piscicida]MDP2543408.1 CidB/LrgB family autolysis modulator [Photobacterium 
MIWLVATLVCFYVARYISGKIKNPLLNPLLITLIVLIVLLKWLQVPYEVYFADNKIINFLLGPAVVALALPLYQQLAHIRSKWKTIMTACFVGSVLSMTFGTAIAFWMGADAQLAASILPKSITTPLAMAASQQIGGIPSITAAMVILVGIFGAVLGYPIMKLLKIEHPLAKGLSMGSVSHALGTAKAAEEDYQEGAFSSLALVICGIMTTILAPILFPILVHLFS